MCEQTPPASLTVPTNLHAAAVARRFLRACLCEAHHARVVDEAELLVSELVTNGVRYGAPPVQLRVTCDGQAGLRVEVRDTSPALPRRRQPEADEESGRGLELVDVISDAWGVSSDGDGKVTWFELHRDPGLLAS